MLHEIESGDQVSVKVNCVNAVMGCFGLLATVGVKELFIIVLRNISWTAVIFLWLNCSFCYSIVYFALPAAKMLF